MRNTLCFPGQQKSGNMRRKKICSAENSVSPFYMQYYSPCLTSFPVSMPFYITHRVFLKWQDLVRKILFYSLYISAVPILFSHLLACRLLIRLEEKHC